MTLTRKDKLLYYQLLTLALLALTIALVWFSFTAPGIDAAPAPTSTPAPMVTPTPGNTGQASIFWGDTLHLLCYESPEKQATNQPNGILNFDVTGSEVVAINCRAPGTEGEGVEVRLKDGGE